MSQAGTLNQGGSGGLSNIQKVGVDASTPPGTNPVVANAANEIIVTGGQVDAGTTSNVIRTDSLSANTFTIEIQRATTAAVPTIGLNGVSHYNAAQFTVDPNGFVSLAGSIGITFDGDSGSATPSGDVLNIIADSAAVQAGKTVTFSASGNTVLLEVTDAHANTLIGKLSGFALTTGIDNTSLGYESLQSISSGVSNTSIGWTSLNDLSTGSFNTALGAIALQNIPNGSYNIGIGYSSGSNYTTTESSNIVIGNAGSGSESHVLRIGTQGSGNLEVNKAFIAGIVGVTASNSEAVFIDSTTGQLGVISQNADGEIIIGSSAGVPLAATITAGTGITVTNGNNSITIAASSGGFAWSDKSVSFNALAQNGYFIIGNATATLPASPSNGDTIKFFVDGSFTLTIQANTGQKIQFASNVSSSAGTQVNTMSGDSCELVYRSTNTQWEAINFVGAWNKT